MKTKPFSKTKSIVTYVVCGVLIVALAIGNYYASLYKDLITVYTSGSDVVTTDESAKVCQTIEEEGMVLLKNEDGLPLKEGAKVSLLGQDSVDFVYGGSGSGSVDTSQALNLKKAMEASGFEVNETLWDFYDSGAGKDYRKSVPDETGAGEFAVNEVPASVYTDDVKDSFKDYNDAAIVCIGRSGGESADIPTEPLASGYKYLELDQDERDMLTMACQNFDNVVVLVNANNAMELGFLNDEAYKNVKAWVYGAQSVTDGQAVRLRLLEPMAVADKIIPRNAVVVGTAKIQGERLDIEITSLEYAGTIIPVELAVYDTDGQPGIFIPNSMEMNAVREVAANMGGSLGSSINISTNAGAQLASDLGKGLIQGTSQYIAKKMRTVKVHLKSGYKVMLYQDRD